MSSSQHMFCWCLCSPAACMGLLYILHSFGNQCDGYALSVHDRQPALVPLKVSEDTSKRRLISSAGAAGEGGRVCPITRFHCTGDGLFKTHSLLASYRLLHCIRMQKRFAMQKSVSTLYYGSIFLWLCNHSCHWFVLNCFKPIQHFFRLSEPPETAMMTTTTTARWAAAAPCSTSAPRWRCWPSSTPPPPRAPTRSSPCWAPTGRWTSPTWCRTHSKWRTHGWRSWWTARCWWAWSSAPPRWRSVSSERYNHTEYEVPFVYRFCHF